MDSIFQPFEYLFMKRALAGCLILSLGSCPIGVLLVLRRMSLIGDALSHAIFLGVAGAYSLFGLSFLMMSVGGFVSGVCVAILAGVLSRRTHMKEDASFAAFVVLSLALGVLLVSLQRRSVDLLQVLFGSILAIGREELLLMAIICFITFLLMMLFYRPFVYECCDVTFFGQVSKKVGVYHTMFLILIVCNLIAGFQTIGTLLSVGLMVLPAIIARFWFQKLTSLLIGSVLIGCVSGIIGLYAAFFLDWPAGPGIIIVMGALYAISAFIGRYGSMRCLAKS
ncbi:MAG: metal ABC transporter permease [Alphaproteobacteria bacterium]|nr:metal ABC transporter permease [Alphaproteobacteria bacterium]